MASSENQNPAMGIGVLVFIVCWMVCPTLLGECILPEELRLSGNSSFGHVVWFFFLSLILLPLTLASCAYLLTSFLYGFSERGRLEREERRIYKEERRKYEAEKKERRKNEGEKISANNNFDWDLKCLSFLVGCVFLFLPFAWLGGLVFWGWRMYQTVKSGHSISDNYITLTIWFVILSTAVMGLLLIVLANVLEYLTIKQECRGEAGKKLREQIRQEEIQNRERKRQVIARRIREEERQDRENERQRKEEAYNRFVEKIRNQERRKLD